MAEYIEKEAAFEILCVCYPLGMDEECYDRMHALIRNRRPANVRENVKGEWDDKPVAFYHRCPFCLCHVRKNLGEVFLDRGELNFCPNCGADMTGGNDG